MYKYKNYKKNFKKMVLLEDPKMSLLNFNFVMIDIYQKMLILIKINLNYLKDSISDFFFKEHARLLIFEKKIHSI